jgi:hypothetical protein
MSTDHPDSFQIFVLPGGNTFAFKGSRFLGNQDLLAAINYGNPNSE